MLTALLALVVRANACEAAPANAATADAALAIRYANALTGSEDDEDTDEIDDDGAASNSGDDGDDGDLRDGDGDGDLGVGDGDRDVGDDRTVSADDTSAIEHGTADLTEGDGPDLAAIVAAAVENIGEIDNLDDDAAIDDAGEPGGRVGELAQLDAEQSPPGSVGDDDARIATSSAGGDEAYETWMRHRRPSPWGRLDVGLVVRRSTTAPLHTPAYHREELWLVATWRH